MKGNKKFKKESGLSLLNFVVISCLLCRFIGTYMLGFLCNRKRIEKIGLLDQFIIAYGGKNFKMLVFVDFVGLRGAICYGLAMTLDSDTVPAKDVGSFRKNCTF